MSWFEQFDIKNWDRAKEAPISTATAAAPEKLNLPEQSLLYTDVYSITATNLKNLLNNFYYQIYTDDQLMSTSIYYNNNSTSLNIYKTRLRDVISKLYYGLYDNRNCNWVVDTRTTKLNFYLNDLFNSATLYKIPQYKATNLTIQNVVLQIYYTYIASSTTNTQNDKTENSYKTPAEKVSEQKQILAQEIKQKQEQIRNFRAKQAQASTQATTVVNTNTISNDETENNYKSPAQKLAEEKQKLAEEIAKQQEQIRNFRTKQAQASTQATTTTVTAQPVNDPTEINYKSPAQKLAEEKQKLAEEIAKQQEQILEFRASQVSNQPRQLEETETENEIYPFELPFVNKNPAYYIQYADLILLINFTYHARYKQETSRTDPWYRNQLKNALTIVYDGLLSRSCIYYYELRSEKKPQLNLLLMRLYSQNYYIGPALNNKNNITPQNVKIYPVNTSQSVTNTAPETEISNLPNENNDDDTYEVIDENDASKPYFPDSAPIVYGPKPQTEQIKTISNSSSNTAVLIALGLGAVLIYALNYRQ